MSHTASPRSIVPAFFVIDATSELADERASDICIALNNRLHAETNAPQARLYLCEGSPTTEFPDGLAEEDVPHTLEGLTCDAPGAAPTTIGAMDAVDLLLLAYARAAEGHSVDWDDLGAALERARQERPGRYEALQALVAENA